MSKLYTLAFYNHRKGCAWLLYGGFSWPINESIERHELPMRWVGDGCRESRAEIEKLLGYFTIDDTLVELLEI